MDSILILAIIILVFALIEATCVRSQLSDDAEQWRRFSGWFRIEAARFDQRYDRWHPTATAVDLIRRLRRAGNDGKQKPIQASIALRRASEGKLASEFYECLHCRQRIHKTNDAWVHTDSGSAACTRIGLCHAKPAAVWQ